MVNALRSKLASRADVVVERISSLATTAETFTRATVIILTHGAATVNAPLLRINAGLVIIDSEAPPLLPIAPAWVHFAGVRAGCVPAGKFRCGDQSSFHDLALRPRGVAAVVDAVPDILDRQRHETAPLRV